MSVAALDDDDPPQRRDATPLHGFALALNSFHFVSGEGEAGQPSANKAVSQEFVHATDDEKDNLLWKRLCELEAGSRVIVFANTKRRVEMLAKTFEYYGTCAIHGDKQQREREAALRAFTNEESR